MSLFAMTWEMSFCMVFAAMAYGLHLLTKSPTATKAGGHIVGWGLGKLFR